MTFQGDCGVSRLAQNLILLLIFLVMEAGHMFWHNLPIYFDGLIYAVLQTSKILEDGQYKKDHRSQYSWDDQENDNFCCTEQQYNKKLDFLGLPMNTVVHLSYTVLTLEEYLKKSSNTITSK